MNQNMAREGAKTDILLRGIYCVNILAAELRDLKKGHSLEYLQTKDEAFITQFLLSCSWLTNHYNSNISVTGGCFSSKLKDRYEKAQEFLRVGNQCGKHINSSR